jgi:hypothetical protein
VFYVYTYVIDGVPRYVGKGKGRRWKTHRTAPTHLGRKLQQVKRSVNEWVIPAFTNCETEEAAKTEETRLIKLYGRADLGMGTLYNLTDGGEGASGYQQSAEANAKRSVALKGRRKTLQARTNMIQPKADQHKAKISLSKSWKYEVTNPHGETYVVDSLKLFAESHGLKLFTLKTASKHGKPINRGSCAGWKVVPLNKGK